MGLNWRKPILQLALNLRQKEVARQLDFVRSVSKKSADGIREVQNDRLTALLLHAWEQTEYYREILSDCSVVRDGEVFLDNFSKIPFLTKDILGEEGARLKARVLPPGRTEFLNRTGGSTGQPCEYWQDSVYDAGNMADKLFHFEQMGKALGEPEMKIWGSDRDLMRDTSGLAVKIRNFVYNRRVENCSLLSDERIDEIVDSVNRFRPRLIWGYIDGMFAISEYVLKKGLKIHAPAAVFCGGGTFFPLMQEAIEKAFRCPAINYYGSREMGAVACRCESGGSMHITSHTHVVEVVDSAENPIFDQDGDLILTSLTNYAMPFIRYKIGDRGCMASKMCSCGQGFPILTSVSGRSMESFITSEGALVSPIFLITMIGTSLRAGLIKKFQLIQEDFALVRLKVIPATDDRSEIDEALNTIDGKLRKMMGDGCTIEHEFVEVLPRTPSGKYLYTMRNIPDAKVAQVTTSLSAYGSTTEAEGS